MLVLEGDKIVAVKMPLSQADMDILRPFTGMGQAVYIPFDPYTFEVPDNTNEFKVRQLNDVKLTFSPNVYALFMTEYVKTDQTGRRYFTSFPLLFVDYKTPQEMYYYGTTEPPERPLQMQVYDWKHGYQLSRASLPNDLEPDLKITVCVGESPILGCIPKTYYYNRGYYWVKHQARLIDAPASLISANRDVLKIYYKKPEGVLFKIPGFSSIADYIIKRKLSSEGVAELRKLVNMFGYDLDSTPYVTDAGKTVSGPYVEDTKDGYVVYLPVVKTGSLGPEIPVGAIVAVIVAISFAVGVYYIYRITSKNQEAMKVYLDAVTKAQENYSTCIESCNKLPTEEERAKCRKGCQEAYNKAINESQNAWLNYIMSSGFAGIAEVLKWGVAAAIVLQAISMLRRPKETTKEKTTKSSFSSVISMLRRRGE